MAKHNPVFGKATTPSCIGYLPEYFRTQVPGVVRSLHATHSCCAIGKYAEEIVANHELDNTPVGKNSPFAKLPHCGGKILMLGCDKDQNTTMHGVEESVDPIPHYAINPSYRITYTLKDGDKTIEIESFHHNFFDENGDRIVQCCSRIIDLLEGDEISHDFVLDADCHLMDARAVWKKGHDKIVEDETYFVQYNN